MFETHKGRLCVLARWLTTAGVITEANYRTLTGRGQLLVARRGGFRTPALVDYETMPQRLRERVAEVAGGDPYRLAEGTLLSRAVRPDGAAWDALSRHTVCGRHLPDSAVRRYHAQACVLRACLDIVGRPGRRGPGWDELAAQAAALDSVAWPHGLPRNAQSLERKARRFEAGGPASLVHGGFGNTNAARVSDPADEAALLALASDPRNLTNAQVAALYAAARPGSPTVSEASVARFRQAREQEIFARRRGATEFRATRLMTVRRTAPTAPLLFWSLDGWDAELLYQKTAADGRGRQVTTYHNRVKLEVVLDACTAYPVGFAIGDTETPALVKAALADALRHARALFGGRFRPHQLQMDHAGLKTLMPLYAMTARHVTPAAVRNAKAKPVEGWFRRFNDRYCHLAPNWSGYGIQARREAQPNRDLLAAGRRAFPDRAGVEAQLRAFVEAERARLRAEYVARWEQMDASLRLPMTDEEWLLAYGERTGRAYLWRPAGLRATLPGAGPVVFDCFDHDFRRHAATPWTLVYDAADPRLCMALSADGRMRFALEEKHAQPMALAERRPGDAEQLERVRRFNRDEERRVAEALGGMGGAALAAREGGAVVSADFETLAKLVIPDSRGRHKELQDEARLRQEAEAAADPADISDRY